MKLPKCIHMVWLGKKKFPNESRTFLKTWSNKNYDFETNLWQDNDADKLMSNSILKDHYFLTQDVGFKSDLLRYEILNTHGGVYVDTDMECLRPIECLVSHSAFTYADQNKAEPAIGFLASEPKSQFIKYLIPILDAHIRNGIHKNDVFNRTLEMSGPNFLGNLIRMWFSGNPLSPIYNKYGCHIGNKLKDTSALFEWTVYPYNPCTSQKHYNPKLHARAYAIHHWNASWA